MKYNNLFLVSLTILAIFMLSAVGATDDISVDNLTVEENVFNSIEEVSDEVELDENEENNLIESTSEDISSEKESISMEVCIWWDSEIGGVIDEFSPGHASDKYVKVSLPKKVNGTLSLYMDGKFISEKNITAKTHYFNVDVDDIGEHTAEVKYSGNDQYSASSASTTFEVVSCYIDIEDIVYSSNYELLTVHVYGPTNNPDPIGDVVVIINGKRYTAPIIRGYALIKLQNLDIGEHEIHVDYLGDDKHASRSIDTLITVYPEILIGNSIGFDDKREVSLQLPSDANGNLMVKVDEDVIGNVKLVNGYASISLNNLNKFGHDYELVAEYTSDDYNVGSLDILYSLNPKIDLEYEMILNQKYTFSSTLPSTYSGVLELEVPGYDDLIKAKVVNGKASVDFLAKMIGKHNIFLNYYGDNDEEYGDRISIFVGPNPNMVASVESKVGQNPVVKVNVANDAGGAISVFINGKEYTSSYFTKSGSLEIPGLADGKYTAVVTYSGDYKYPSVTKTVTFTKTSKTPTKISLKLTKVKVKKSAKKLVLKATLKINGKVAKGKKITFKFNKKTYKTKTNKNGVAKITIKKSVLKKLKVGKKVKYQASYGKTTVKKTVKVKK